MLADRGAPSSGGNHRLVTLGAVGAPFLVLYPEVLVKLYSIGARVAQTSYGAGTVTLANEYHTVIDFDEHGVRTFATRIVQLEQSDTVAPERPKRARRKTGPRLPKA
jgi:hypothetical protein